MGSYHGKATLIAVDGTDAGEVDAALVAPDDDDAADPWFGTIRGDFDAFDLMDGSPVLRLPDGRESKFQLTRTDLVLPRNGLPIVGTGEPPF